MSNPLGEVLRVNGRIGLRYERRLAHPPDVVWRALTESDQLRHWLPCDIVGERRAGASLTLPFWPAHVAQYDIPENHVSMSGEIREWDPPRVFEWTWDVDVLRWELTPVEGGTLLVFTTVIGESDDHGYAPAQTAAGYHACLDELTELLDTGTVRTPLVDVSVAELEAVYTKVVEPDALT